MDDKVLNEASLMKYIADNTNIPVPRVIAYGKAEDNPTGLGPFIIMTWVEGTPMSEVLRKKTPEEENDDYAFNLDIDEKTLETLYGQMAGVLLELWKLDFDRIGTLRLDESGKLSIEGLPLTQQTNELIRTGNVHDCVPSSVYHSSVDYIFSLLEMQKINLERQRNSVFGAEDCREKYTCRHFMKATALNFIRNNNGPFKLFCDGFHPRNVLVDETTLQITGVIDWEFCYAAPPQFSESVPWWLILQRPEDYMNDKSYLPRYLDKADLFLRILQQRENVRSTDTTTDRLSARMRQSLRDKTIWFNLVCVKFTSVDAIYWNMLDEYCWGPSSRAERVYQFTTVLKCIDIARTLCGLGLAASRSMTLRRATAMRLNIRKKYIVRHEHGQTEQYGWPFTFYSCPGYLCPVSGC